MEDESNLKGLTGWLILIGLGVVLGPIRMLVTIMPNYLPILTDGSWELLTSPSSEAYNPLLAAIIIGELFVNLILLLGSVYLVYLFFTKHTRFPNAYILLVVVSFIFIPFDAWVVTFALPDEPMFDTPTTVDFLRVLSTAIVWIPYLLLSKRVKATFVEHSPNNAMVTDS
jgi:hypothetical protein